MLSVKTPDEASCIISEAFKDIATETETVPLTEALHRVAACDIVSNEFVPDFNRSTVDGFALSAASTFGCSESIPALLPLEGEVLMGEFAQNPLRRDTCIAVPTGGHVPDGADAVVMLEYTENYGDGTIGVLKSCAPGENMIYRGDDVKPGDVLIPQGTVITSHDIGGLASMGQIMVPVRKRPVVGIISTGDELVDAGSKPAPGQIRDVNSSLLFASVSEAGGTPVLFGAVKDDRALLREYVDKAVRECDIVLISGGSSVGMKDATADIIAKSGEILFHGIAIKPGKPTILGKIGKKPVFGLPGHPVAAHFITRIFVRPLISKLMCSKTSAVKIKAYTSEAISSNHGRAECIGIVLEEKDGKPTAHPIHGKSGLITTLSGSDGFIIVPRDCEGLPKGAEIDVTLYR